MKARKTTLATLVLSGSAALVLCFTVGDKAAAETAQVIQSASPASAVQFHDLAGRSFALSRVTCLIDGRTVYSGPGGKSLQLFHDTLAPGSHTVTVQADYRIKIAGPFSYTKGFQFKVLSGRRFSVESGQPVRVSVVGYERGGPTRAFDERLALAIIAG